MTQDFLIKDKVNDSDRREESHYTPKDGVVIPNGTIGI